MGKKSDNEAQDLFNELLSDEIKSAVSDITLSGIASSKTATKTAHTQTKEATVSRPPKLNPTRKPRKGFEDIDPILEQMLVHPEPTNVGIAPEELGGEEAEPEAQDDFRQELTPAPVKQASKAKPPQKPKEKAKDATATNTNTLNLIKSDMSVAANLSEKQERVEASEDLDLRDNEKTQKIAVAKMVEVPDPKAKGPVYSQMSGSGLEDQLRSANYLELAQNRVLELEKDVQKLRRDNEQLASAGQHFKELTETIKQQLKQSEANFFNLKEIAEEEKKILTQSLEAKEIKIGALQERLIELEEKINSSFDHVRIRERELENRLEIMKTESEAVTSSKDEMILDLKKQLNLVNSDLEKYRIQNQKITIKMDSKEELLRRTVKALRIALTMLEGSRPDEDN